MTLLLACGLPGSKIGWPACSERRVLELCVSRRKSRESRPCDAPTAMPRGEFSPGRFKSRDVVRDEVDEVPCRARQALS